MAPLTPVQTTLISCLPGGVAGFIVSHHGEVSVRAGPSVDVSANWYSSGIRGAQNRPGSQVSYSVGDNRGVACGLGRMNAVSHFNKTTYHLAVRL